MATPARPTDAAPPAGAAGAADNPTTMPRRIRIRPVQRQYVVKWQLITSTGKDKLPKLLGAEQFREVTATSRDEAKDLFLADPPPVPDDCALVSNAYRKGQLPGTTYAQILEKAQKSPTTP